MMLLAVSASAEEWLCLKLNILNETPYLMVVSVYYKSRVLLCIQTLPVMDSIEANYVYL